MSIRHPGKLDCKLFTPSFRIGRSSGVSSLRTRGRRPPPSMLVEPRHVPEHDVRRENVHELQGSFHTIFHDICSRWTADRVQTCDIERSVLGWRTRKKGCAIGVPTLGFPIRLCCLVREGRRGTQVRLLFYFWYALAAHERYRQTCGKALIQC